MLITKTQRRAKGTAHRIQRQTNTGHNRWSWPGVPRGLIDHSPTEKEAMVLPGLFLSCPSEHGAKQRLEGSLHLWVAAYHPSFRREEGWGRGWHPCRPTGCWALGTRGGGYKLCANILPSPQDIFFNKRPWKCQLV